MSAYGTSRRETGHYHVERSGLLSHVGAEIGRTGIVFVQGPVGYGKTTLLHDIARLWRMEHSAACPSIVIECASSDSTSFMKSYAVQRESGATIQDSLDHATRGLNRSNRVGTPASGRSRKRGRASEPSTDSHGAGDHGEARDLGGLIAACQDIPLCHLIACHLRSHASRWVASLTLPTTDASEGFGPLIVIDDLPDASGDRQSATLARFMRDLMDRGARFVVSCLPSSEFASAHFPDAPVVGSGELVVGEGESVLWERDLHLAMDVDLFEQTHGVPLLIDACRVTGPARSRSKGRTLILRSARIVEACIREPASIGIERLRWAMTLLGSGQIADLACVGLSTREDDLSYLATWYPHFGIDRASGSFSCIPTCVNGSESLFSLIVGFDPDLAGRCVELLLSSRRLERAGAIARLLPEHVLVHVLNRHPLEFADLSFDDVILRGLHFASQNVTVHDGAYAGLLVLDGLRARFRGRRPVLEARSSSLMAATPYAGALLALDALSDAWSQVMCSGEALGSTTKGPVSPQGPDIETKVGLTLTCTRMLEAAVRGDAACVSLMRPHLLELARERDATTRGALVHFCAFCDLLSGQYVEVVARLTPVVSAARASGDRWGASGPWTLTQALLSLDLSLGRVLIERISSQRASSEELERIRAARAFIERRGVQSLRTLARSYEVAALFACGREVEAHSMLEDLMSMHGRQGDQFGQMLALLGLSVVCAVTGKCGQASAYASIARQLAGRPGLGRYLELCDLLTSIVSCRARVGAELDRRLLEVTLLESSLHPKTSLPLEMEKAILSLTRGAEQEARDALENVAASAEPGAVRLACLCMRALGPGGEGLLELMPDALRSDCQAFAAGGAFQRGEAQPVDAPITLPQGSHLSIQLLGGFRVTHNGHQIETDEWRRAKARQLLGLLALNADRPLPRDEAMGLLWPDSDPELARMGLYSALSSLRGVLGQKHGGPQFVKTAGRSLQLDLEIVDIDVREFEQIARTVLSRRDGLSSGRVMELCTRMEEMYGVGGDFADGELGEVGAQRDEELRSLFVDCMTYASGVACDEGNGQLALWFARLAKRELPLRDDVCAALAESLKTLAAQGKSAGAVLALGVTRDGARTGVAEGGGGTSGERAMTPCDDRAPSAADDARGVCDEALRHELSPALVAGGEASGME